MPPQTQAGRFQWKASALLPDKIHQAPAAQATAPVRERHARFTAQRISNSFCGPGDATPS